MTQHQDRPSRLHSDAEAARGGRVKRRSAPGIFRVLVALFVLFFAYVIYAANQGALPLAIRQLIMFPGGDKLGHVVLLGVLSFLLNYVLASKRMLVWGRSIMVGSLVIFILISLEEVSQIYISARTFDWLDLLSSYLGIVMGDVGVRFLKRG